MLHSDLGPTPCAILYILANSPDLPTSTIASRLGSRMSTAEAALTRLHDGGFIAAHSDMGVPVWGLPDAPAGVQAR